MARFQVAPTFIAQSVVEFYPACKDLFLHVKSQGRDIKKLENRLSELIALMASIMSRKDEIERCLRNSVLSKKTKEFEMLETIIADIDGKCTKFINKYTKITRRRLCSSADARSIIQELENLRSRVLTFNFLKLAKLSRDVAKMAAQACVVLERLNPEHMICKRLELNQEKFDVDGDDLAFYNAYVDEVLKHLCENGSKVGILGGSSTGKTIVLRKLFNRLIELKSSFSGSDEGLELDFIIWLEYPQEVEGEAEVVEKLQNEIMGQLSLDHEAKMSVHMNGDRISAFLCHKKYILLLDKVLRNVDFGRVGLREHHEYKKLVVSSSDRNVTSLLVESVFEI
ncbi:uncharacterized protein LOC130997009 [Salvia miltiorrhiza]|uniref:uncharacterized protein LOC130997009 n=1 Tax=Salvia miltiorrhiza TaxID=226208 RepID=UPI0025ACCE3E|nr:uncharacterized protein LOC130997009 [Salvia miltiorrhiza]